jgi:cytochrome P450
MKQGDVVSLEGHTTRTDPELVDDPEELRPERWFPEAFEVRRGTNKEIIDLIPFSKIHSAKYDV